MQRRLVTRYLLAACASTVIGYSACDSTEPRRVREMLIVSGDTQTSRPGEELPVPLRVRAIGTDNAPYAGATVRWRVAVGDATVTPLQSTTNANGEAEARVTMGSAIGIVNVSAGIAGGDSVTFASIALNPCEWFNWPTLSLGAIAAGRLRALDCVSNQRYVDLYPFQLNRQQALAFSLRSTGFDPEVQLHSFAPWYYYVNDTINSRRNLRFKAILPASTFGVAVTSVESLATGDYEFSVAPTTSSVETCELVFVMLGVTTDQSLSSIDCARPDGTYSDEYSVVFLRGQRVRVVATSAEFAPRIEILSGGQRVATADGASTATVILTAPADGLYTLRATSASAGNTGNYSLSINLDGAVSPSASRHGRLRFGVSRP